MSPPLPPLAELAPGLSAAGKLDPSDIEALAASGVRTIINNRPDDEDPGQLPAAEARRLAAAADSFGEGRHVQSAAGGTVQPVAEIGLADR